MASPPPPRGRSWASGDDTLFVAAVVIAIALGVIGYMSWTRNHAEISRSFALLAHWHIQLIQYVTDEYDGLDRRLLGADYGRVTLGGIYATAASIGLWFRVPVAVLLGVLSVACFFRSPSYPLPAPLRPGWPRRRAGQVLPHRRRLRRAPAAAPRLAPGRSAPR